LTLDPGTLLGPYEIVAPVGAGGMGEVYRARDTRLDRTVAIKVPLVSASPEARQRFEREARAISKLSHPHICALYDVGEKDGLSFLVMEYLEGESLCAKLAKGPLPLDAVLRHGLEIADALDKAHRQGIVHRDLKPGNVMLTRSGVKLLDFGLAKAIAPQSVPSGTSQLATETGANLTAEGSILGTFQYMAPEQLEGRAADARTDIFALGAVLYEMATGKPAFSGRSQASLISSIMTANPAPIEVAATPPVFDRVVRTCLAKDPDERWQTAHDVALQLRWIQEAEPATSPRVVPHRLRRGVPWLLAAAASTAFLALLARDLRRPTPQPEVTRFTILPPGKTLFTPPGELSSAQFAISPDGRALAFVANAAGGRPMLWVRRLDSLSATQLAGTEEALHPFWSPDGRSIGFFTATALKKVDAAGGTPQKLCDTVAGRGGSWSRERVIVFAHSTPQPLFRVPDTGGEPEEATELEGARGEVRHRFPFFLPDGKRFLFWAYSPATRESGIYVASLGSRKARLVVKSSVMGQSGGGYLVTVQGGVLAALPFDEESATVTGKPIHVQEAIVTGNPPGYAPFAVSGAGVLAYSSASAKSRQLSWFDRAGRRIGTIGEPGDYSTPSLSPDEKRIAVAIHEESRADTDIWVFDDTRESWSRLTFDPANERSALWSPDGSRIIYCASVKGLLDLYEKPSSGGGEARLLLQTNTDKFPTDWTSDGRYIVYHTFGADSFWDLWALPTDGGKPFAIFSSRYTEVQGKVSPDGRWIAYASDESGRLEIYVTEFPKKQGHWQISKAGGSQPYWRREGKELFYVGPDQTLMSAAVHAGETFAAEAPVPVLKANFPPVVPAYWGNYAVTANGQRFLVAELVPEASSIPINVVLNWTAGLK
jgi:serine/threonine protein kinase/Tol biopolymer transport system component